MTRMRRTLLLSLLLITLALQALPAAPAAAQEPQCVPAGDQAITPATPAPGDFRVTGGGYGHGAGMSQYGAQGAARLGCDAATILRTYYPGADVTTIAMPERVRVSLDTDARSQRVIGVAGTVPWELCRDGACRPIGLDLTPDHAWTVAVEPDPATGVRYVIREGDRELWRGGDRYELLRARLSSSDDERRIVRLGNRYRWGVLEFDSVANDPPTMFVTLDIAPFDRYLYGLAEVPSSWPEEALRAQVIAARSYAVTRRQRYGGNRAACRCDLYATTIDQAYSGYEKEAEGSQGQFGARWRAAVDGTRSPDFSAALGLTFQGQVADAFYSSSHGGYSESTQFVFGGALEYHRPVDDTRWDSASDNPFRAWSATFSADDLGARLGVGRALEVRSLHPMGVGCRVGDTSRGWGGVEVRGTERTRVVGGNEFRRALGLRSTLFAVNADAGGGCPTGGPAGVIGAAPAPPPPPPLPPPPPPPPPEDPAERLAGPSRVHTAAAAARSAWDGSGVAVLTTGRAFPDALSAAAVAADLDAPVLLLDQRDTLPDEVRAELTRLGVTRVVVVGGPGAVGEPVARALLEAGLEVERLSGPDRFATAADAAAAAGVGADGTVALALGTDFADAVAAGTLAAGQDGMPVLLTERDRLPAATELALSVLGARRVVLVGGPAAISAAVEARVSELGYAVERLAGPDRFATSAATARAALERLGGDSGPVVLATGRDFPDALAAGALAARVGGPLLLVDGQDLAASPAARAFLEERADRLDRVLVVGGSAIVSDTVRTQAARAIA